MITDRRHSGHTPRDLTRQEKGDDMATSRFASFVFGAAAVLLSSTGVAVAQLPAARLDGIFPAGGSPGATVETTITGANLDDADRLHFSHPGITAERKLADPGPFDEGPQPVPNEFVVTIKQDVPPGHYTVRTQGKYGISNPRTFEVSAIAESREEEPNNTEGEATPINGPLLINGQINGAADVDCYRFDVTAGEKLQITCHAQKLDSLLDAVVTVTDTGGRVLAEAQAGPHGDAALHLAAESDSQWVIRVTDSLYRGGPQYVYRLTIGALPHVDFVFPPSAVVGSSSEFTLFGSNLPGGQPAGIELNGRPLETLAVQIAMPGDVANHPLTGIRLSPEQAELDLVPYRVTAPTGFSNPVLISAATAPVILEQDGNDSPENAQAVELPCEVAGRFWPRGDRDWFEFTAAAGEVVNLELFSQRLGLPTDPALVIQQVTVNDDGEEQTSILQRVDDLQGRDSGYGFDTRSEDPAIRFTAPADATYRVLLLEGHSALHDDPRLVYRFSMRPDQPDFRLVAVPADASGALLLRKGGRDSIRVVAFRRDGFDAPITVTATGLPEGVTASEVVIGPASTAATLILTAAENAAPAIGQVQIVGKAVVNDQEVTRTARAGTVLAPVPLMAPNQQGVSFPARLTESITLAVSAGETAPVLITAGEDKLWETSRGGILKIPYSVVRRGDYKGNITAFPVDVPPNVQAQQFAINGNTNSGEFEIRMTANTPPGTYTFYLAGQVQGLPYRRNPEAAEAAAERKTRFEKILAETTEKSKAAADAATKAKQTLDTANAELKKAGDARTAAMKVVTDAETALKNATAATEAANKAAAASPDDANRKKAAADAAAAQTEAEKALKTAQDALAAAEKVFESATAAAKTAGETKTKADMEAADAAALLQEAQRLKQQADQQAQQAANAANPRNINYWTPSTSVNVKIVEFPISMDGPAETAAVKQGEMVELPVKITRMYAFEAPVTLQTQLPGGVGGISIPNVQIPQGQTDGKLVVSANANATPGEHDLNVRVQMNFNGQNLTFDRPVKLTVEEVKPEQ
ncbi:MAG: hypothetical protein DWQ34_23180 [Planctomycetota bacterium]|nr:MAG: hypothetical protein DWQ34_23180 [Planctomycetota bacterium]